MPTPQNLRRPLVLASVMAAMFMIAIEATIVSTAMPQIAGQLGDLHLYSWVFSAFLLTQTATTVVFGKLADLYGRKPVMLVGIAVFLVGSVLCGLAWSMPSLIVFRLLQGIGAGAIQPVCLTVVGDLYSAQERGKIQGYLASVWGISSVFGPLAGGLIIQDLNWAWIFWINVPIGIAAAAGFIAFLHEGVLKEARSVDVTGAALFAVTVASLMVAITEAGTSSGRTVLAWSALCAVSAILFVLQERRARDPMLAFGLWARRPIATANAATLLSGMAVIGLTTFLPMYVQAVLNESALVAGFALTMMVLGWPIGATTAAKNFARFGLRSTLLFGAALLPLGALAFVVMGPQSSPLLAGLGSIVMGLGMGFLSTSAIVIIQDSVGWEERGSATASNVFSRNLGSTLGATVLGSVLNLSLSHAGAGTAAVDFDRIRQLLDHPGSLPGDAGVRLVLGQSLHFTFLSVFLIAVATLLVATLVPAVAFARRARHAPGE
ncbi:MAG: Major facilitator superfamily 1 [Roseomonas sp.]|nr:Major facilitator superfamily 1 [Roseomonas sp.]